MRKQPSAGSSAPKVLLSPWTPNWRPRPVWNSSLSYNLRTQDQSFNRFSPVFVRPGTLNEPLPTLLTLSG